MAYKLPDAVPHGGIGLGPPQKSVSVNLQYWNTGSQCISEWNSAELKKFRKTIDKIQDLTPAKVRTDPGLRYKPHSGPPKGQGFSLPSSMPRDSSLCEFRVGDKGRIHGWMTGDQFFLVWLDRNHAVFPSGK